MKIALIGYGKMGKMIEQAALSQGHTIVAIIDPKCPIKHLTEESVKNADVCLDFTRPDQAIPNLTLLAKWKKNVVMGTTGWTDHLNEAKTIVNESNIGFIYSPNFSLGVAIFLKLIDNAAKLIAPFAEYDVSGYEIHHNQKLDRPSGTAQTISDVLHQNLPHKKTIELSSIRVGSTPGTHSVILDSPFDTITLTHTARNREGFATGAIRAGEWLKNKKGFYTLNDMIKDLYE